MKIVELKDKLRHGMIEYGLNVVYLSVVFGAFRTYKWLLLADHGIDFGDYGFAVIEALVLGKLIMVASVFHPGRGLEQRPLIYAIVYKTIVFCVFVAAFKWIEHGVVGWWHGEGVGAGLAAFAAKGGYEVLANSLVVFVAFIPFFGIKELSRVLGRITMARLIFSKRDHAAEPG